MRLLLVIAAILYASGSQANQTLSLRYCTQNDLGSCIQPFSDPPVEQAQTWHLLTISYGGTVSLIKGLTKDECEKTRIKSLPGDGGQCIKRNPDGTIEDRGVPCDIWPSDIKTAECFE